jgi:hypothetical protein
MDMKRYLRRWLTDAELRRLGDRYEGVIAEILEERLRNRFTGTKEAQPVIVFDDGYRLVPNLGMRQALIEFWGRESADWTGRRLIVFRRAVEQRGADGETKTTYQRAVMRPDAEVAEFRRRVKAV